MNGRRRGQLYRLHSWLGLLAALPLLVVAGSGVILGFYDHIRHASAPYRLEKPVSPHLPPVALAEAAGAAWPTGRLETLYLPSAVDRSARAVMVGDKRVTVFLHPASGALLAVRDADRSDWLEFVRRLHHGNQLGLAGEIAVAAIALAIVILWLTGFALHRRGHLHGLLGRIAGGGLVFLAVSGGILTFGKPLRENFYPPPAASGTAPTWADVSRAVKMGAMAYGRAPLGRIVFPTKAGQPLLLRYRDGGRVFLDHSSAQVLRVETSFSPWLNILYPLHSGRFFGGWGPPLVAALGGVLLFIAASGLVIRRRSGRRIFARKK